MNLVKWPKAKKRPVKKPKKNKSLSSLFAMRTTHVDDSLDALFSKKRRNLT